MPQSMTCTSGATPEVHEQQAPTYLWNDSRAGLFNMNLSTLGRTHTWRDAAEHPVPSKRLPSNLDSPALFTSGATPERARLEGVIPFQARVHLPSERLPDRTPLCAMGAIPITRAPSPRPRTTREPTRTASRKKRRVKHYFGAPLLVGLLSFLSCLLSCGAPCLWVLVCGCLPWGSVLRVPRRRATSPERNTSVRYPPGSWRQWYNM